MKPTGIFIILSVISLSGCGIKAAQQTQKPYLNCVKQEDCTNNCATFYGIKLGNCFDGLCGCYSVAGNGVPPINNSTEVTTGGCKTACDAAGSEFLIIDYDNKKLVKKTRCLTGEPSCYNSKGTCFCPGTSSGELGVLAADPVCKPERYCKVLCSASPSPTNGTGQICTRKLEGKTYNTCFCPVTGA